MTSSTTAGNGHVNGNGAPIINGHAKQESRTPRRRLHGIKSAHHSFWNRMKFQRDYRASLPPVISRFTGYRDPEASLPHEPLPFPPFTWLKHIPLEVETWLFGWIGAFVGILLIEAIMGANTAFQEVYHAPLIITSFGASAVLLFGAIESPVAQPRNFVGGHFLAALTGTWITRLFVLDASYHPDLKNVHFHANTFINGGVSMATSLLVMLVTGTVHPPAGATGLNAAVESQVVTLSWRYLPVIISSSLIMLGWAIFINNLGRRRYPLHWWAPGKTFIREPETDKGEDQLERMEEAQIREEDREEGDFQRENIGTSAEVERAEEAEGEDPELDALPPDQEDLANVVEARTQSTRTGRA